VPTSKVGGGGLADEIAKQLRCQSTSKTNENLSLKQKSHY